MASGKKNSVLSGVALIALAVIALLITGGKDGFSILRDNYAADTLPPDQMLQDPADRPAAARLELPYLLDTDNNLIVEHMGYTLSYNSRYRIPNWVAYELLDSELYGDFEREEKFSPDPLVKGRQAYDRDYVGSGWDRGHMAPSGDMKWSSQAMKECFYLTNVCPQNHNLNMGLWNDLEKQVRYEARYYKRIWVVCGPVMEGNRNGVIGRNHVKVPDAFFKALLARTKEGKYISIGFIFPNQAGKKALSSYAMTVNELEGKIGMDLFYNLDQSVQEEVESRMDPWEWRIK